MRLLADESVDGTVVARLRADGHEVAWIAEDAAGSPDDAVLARAFVEGVVLISADKDFGELVYRHRRPHNGRPAATACSDDPPEETGEEVSSYRKRRPEDASPNLLRRHFLIFFSAALAAFGTSIFPFDSLLAAWRTLRTSGGAFFPSKNVPSASAAA